MPTYAIGDIHGCFKQLKALLSVIHFSPTKDTLWFSGDLINRGPQSLEVLRFIKALPNVISVLGNHELHLLALASGDWPNQRNHTLFPILKASDCEELVQWVRHRPLFHHDPDLGFALVHAGIPPHWTLSQARSHASEVENALRQDHVNPSNYANMIFNLYGNTPDQWRDDLEGWDRLRLITNYFTRMRYIKADGGLDFREVGPPTTQTQAKGLIPWFVRRHQLQQQTRTQPEDLILFGHWSALQGQSGDPRVYSIDGGCVWGNELMAIRLEDKKRFSVPGRVINLNSES